MKELNNGSSIPTSIDIKKALNEYKVNEQNLQDYSAYMMNFDMLFKRVALSYANALSFDMQIVCINAENVSDYNTSQYEKDKKKIEDFITHFDYKTEFRRVLQNIIVNETYFTWLRKSKAGNGRKARYCLQVMPQQYCMLTGYFDRGLLWSMNMNYFLQAGVDIDTYDPSLKKTFIRTMEAKGAPYIPSASIGNRDGQFALWADVDPSDGAFAFKFDTSNFNSVPFLAPYIKDVLRNEEIGALQYNKDIAAAHAILAGELRLFDNAKSGTKANQFAIDPKSVGAFMTKAKLGLGEMIKLAALPTENTKWYQFQDTNSDSYEKQLTISAGLGSNISRVIYSSDRMSNAELQAALDEVYNTVRPVYGQFENFMDFYANRLTSKYKFHFIFDGSNYAHERNRRFDQLTKVADKGLVLPPSAWASVLGYNPVYFEKMLQESKSSDWIDEYSQLMANVNIGQQVGGGEGGRPRIADDALTDSGSDSREDLIPDE